MNVYLSSMYQIRGCYLHPGYIRIHSGRRFQEGAQLCAWPCQPTGCGLRKCQGWSCHIFRWSSPHLSSEWVQFHWGRHKTKVALFNIYIYLKVCNFKCHPQVTKSVQHIPRRPAVTQLKLSFCRIWTLIKECGEWNKHFQVENFHFMCYTGYHEGYSGHPLPARQHQHGGTVALCQGDHVHCGERGTRGCGENCSHHHWRGVQWPKCCHRWGG